MLVVVAILGVAQLLVGKFLLDADMARAPLGLVAVALLLGAVSFAALGLAFTGAVRSAEGSSAVVNAIYLPLTFVSGVFFSVEALPAFLQAIAEVSPLTYLLRLVRDLSSRAGRSGRARGRRRARRLGPRRARGRAADVPLGAPGDLAQATRSAYSGWREM